MDTMKWKVRITVVVLMLTTFMAGVMADKYLMTRANVSVKVADPNPREEVLKIYSNRLNMTDDQKAEMGRILDETSGKYSDLRKSMKPQFDEIRSGARQRIRAMLTTDQQPKYDELVQERDALRQQQQQQKNEGKK